MTLLDLCEIYALNVGAGSNYNAIFADVSLDSRLQISDFCNLLFQKYGNSEPVFNTSNVFKQFSDAFFIRNSDTIKRMLDTLEIEYNPLENYDRHEKITREHETNGEVKGNGQNQDNISAFNSSDFSPNSSGTNSNQTNTVAEEKETTTNETHGNIGVTTSQAMAMEELKLRQFNVLEWIVDKYSNELLSWVF